MIQGNRAAQLLFADAIAEKCKIIARSDVDASTWLMELSKLKMTERFNISASTESSITDLTSTKSAVLGADEQLTGLADRLSVPFMLLPSFSELSEAKPTLEWSQKKVAIVGPESSGKTTLARELAEYFKTLWVPEYSRMLFEFLGAPATQADIGLIVVGQYALQKAYEAFATRPFICDTEPRLSKIWSQRLYNYWDQDLDAMTSQSSFAHYLITRPDMPWEQDPLRCLPHDGAEFFKVCSREFSKLNLPLSEIYGQGPARLQNAMTALEYLWT